MSNVKKALEAEATEEEGITFSYGDKEYTISRPDAWSLDVLEAYENGKIVTAVRHILGDKQYARFKETKPTSKDLQTFTQAMMDRVGMDSGE